MMDSPIDGSLPVKRGSRTGPLSSSDWPVCATVPEIPCPTFFLSRFAISLRPIDERTESSPASSASMIDTPSAAKSSASCAVARSSSWPGSRSLRASSAIRVVARSRVSTSARWVSARRAAVVSASSSPTRSATRASSTASRSSKSPIRSDASAPTSWSFHTIGSTASVDAARPSARPNVPWTWLASRASNARRRSGPPAPFQGGSAETLAATYVTNPAPLTSRTTASASACASLARYAMRADQKSASIRTLMPLPLVAPASGDRGRLRLDPQLQHKAGG